MELMRRKLMQECCSKFCIFDLLDGRPESLQFLLECWIQPRLDQSLRFVFDNLV